MHLMPQQLLRRLHWRLTLIFILAATLTCTLIYVVLACLVVYTLRYSPEALRDLETTLRTKEPEAAQYFANDPPDKQGLTRLLDRAILSQDLGPGIQFEFLYVSSGRYYGAFINHQGEIVASSPDSVTFPPSKNIAPYIDREEQALIDAAWQGQTRAVWNHSHIIMAGPIRKGDKPVAVAFARSDDLIDPKTTWQSFANSLIGFLLTTGMGTIIVGGLLGYVIARWVTHRLLAITRAADAWASGELTAVAPEKPLDEFGLLAKRLNKMADALQQVITLKNTVATLEERQRITRDLHDTVKQEAFATTMMVGSAQKCLESGDSVGLTRALQEAFDLSRQMQTDLSNILMQLRVDSSPALIDRLQSIVSAWQRRSPITIVAQFPIVAANTDPAMVEQVIRIVDEAIANAVKHSQAATIQVTLNQKGEYFLATVTDDGIGIALDEVREGMGFGNMRERAALLPSGRLEIQSTPGSGSRVTLRFAETEEKRQTNARQN